MDEQNNFESASQDFAWQYLSWVTWFHPTKDDFEQLRKRWPLIAYGLDNDEVTEIISYRQKQREVRRITQDIYDKKHKQLKEEQYELGYKLDEYTKADDSYHLAASTILRLARRASLIVKSSEPEEKNLFLNYLLQNPTVKGKTLSYSLRSPFNAILELANCPSGGGHRDLNGTPLRQKYSDGRPFHHCSHYHLTGDSQITDLEWQAVARFFELLLRVDKRLSDKSRISAEAKENTTFDPCHQ